MLSQHEGCCLEPLQMDQYNCQHMGSHCTTEAWCRCLGSRGEVQRLTAWLGKSFSCLLASFSSASAADALCLYFTNPNLQHQHSRRQPEEATGASMCCAGSLE